jgi:phosphohistidine swiveling domain-containing protein
MLLSIDQCGQVPAAGAKARRLAAARQLGLQVPAGLVLLPDEPLPSAAELAAALEQLAADAALVAPPAASSFLPEGVQLQSPFAGGLPGTGAPAASELRFAVRSSAAIEDLAGRSAAGLFTSSTEVARGDVLAAITAVRASGDSAAVRSYCGGPVAVAVLIQPMVPAARLGVLYLRPDGSAVCEERPVGTSEWSDVTPRLLSAGAGLETPAPTVSSPAPDPVPTADPDAALARGARRLGALLRTEDPQTAAAFIEYATSSRGQVWFLQVRPAPPPPDPTPWTQPPDAEALTYVLDRDHNPDPLSAAQTGIVDGVADLVPTLRQRVLHSYLYYAVAAAPGPTPSPLPPLPLAELERRFTQEIAPLCESFLQPLEARLLSPDGALDEQLLADPSRVTVSLAEAWAAYRGVYARYVGELSPVLRRARGELDQLLRSNLGQSLARHGALLSGIGGAQTRRLQELWELGRAGCPRPGLRAHLSRYGAGAPCWDVAVPCDDEQPERVAATARSLARSPSSPQKVHEQAQAPYHAALQRLLDELPRMARGALKALLPQVRAALRIAEDDDVLFFRAQRLLRWALLGRGAALYAAGRLPAASAIFDLPWSLHGDLQPAPAAPPPSTGSTPPEFDPASFAVEYDLTGHAAQGAQQRAAARALVPPTRLCAGQPLWTLPDGVLLTGYGVPAPGLAAGPLRGRARVVRSLDEPLPDPKSEPAGEPLILVLPALLPSWAQELWHARALVTDSGGAFCHGAILARERGLPAVLGTHVATRHIRDGQELWVDATAGRVLVLP